MKKEVALLWEQIERKTDFIMHLAEVTDRSPKTIKRFWFSNDPISNIPKNLEAETKLELKKWIKSQNN